MSGYRNPNASSMNILDTPEGHIREAETSLSIARKIELYKLNSETELAKERETNARRLLDYSISLYAKKHKKSKQYEEELKRYKKEIENDLYEDKKTKEQELKKLRVKIEEELKHVESRLEQDFKKQQMQREADIIKNRKKLEFELNTQIIKNQNDLEDLRIKLDEENQKRRLDNELELRKFELQTAHEVAKKTSDLYLAFNKERMRLEIENKNKEIELAYKVFTTRGLAAENLKKREADINNQIWDTKLSEEANKSSATLEAKLRIFKDQAEIISTAQEKYNKIISEQWLKAKFTADFEEQLKLEEDAINKRAEYEKRKNEEIDTFRANQLITRETELEKVKATYGTSSQEYIDFAAALTKKELADEAAFVDALENVILKSEKEEADKASEKAKDKKKDVDTKIAEETKGLLIRLNKNAELDQKNRKIQEKRAAAKEARAEVVSSFSLTSGKSINERINSIKKMGMYNEDGSLDRIATQTNVIGYVTAAISDLAKQLEQKIDSQAYKKSSIDTRLYGSRQFAGTKFTPNATFWLTGSYWNQMQKDIMKISAVSPLMKSEDIANSMEAMVKKGIAYNVEQRAFLNVIKDKIAATFDAADGTLLKLVRIQQADTTASRLGMEAALNEFLNSMYESTEYLESLASSVRSSMYELEALSGAAEATELEFQMQKWMGSLFSVGVSDSAVSSIAQTFSQLAAGQVEGLTGNGTGNLLIMAANNANISIADMLAKGLDTSETNELMQAMVDYLAKMYNLSSDNRVVQQQIANVFGLKASDLKAIMNLSTSDLKTVSGTSMSYGDMISNLYAMTGKMYQRTSIGEMMSNVWENVNYNLAGSMSSNPVAYMTYKMASLLDSTVGGIALPAISAAGFGVDLETTVADLMRVAAMSTGVIGSLGSLIMGLGNSIVPEGALLTMGITRDSNLKTITRGNGGNFKRGGTTSSGNVSSSGYVGNGSADDVQSKTMSDANDTTNAKKAEAHEDESNPTSTDTIDEHIVNIYNLLNDFLTSVVSGNAVRVINENYGLAWSGSGATSNVASL